MEELWAPVAGYDGVYRVSNLGCVESRKKGRWARLHPWPVNVPSGYLVVKLYRNGQYARPRVHRLVAEAFVPNPASKPGTNHIDGDKQNNVAGNLEWVTPAENMQHAYDTGLAARGEEAKAAKLTAEQVGLIRRIYAVGGATQAKLGRLFGVTASNIRAVVNRESWKHI